MSNFAKRRARCNVAACDQTRLIAVWGMVFGAAGLCVSIGFVALTLMAGS